MLILAQVIISGILSGGIYALSAVGLALIFGVVRLVNFAHGEFLMIAMYFSFWLHAMFGLSPYASLPINLLLMAAVGFIVFRVIMARVLQAEQSIQMLITLALSMVLQNLALMLWRADFRTIRLPVTNAMVHIGQIAVNLPRLIAFIIALGMSVGLYIFLQKTFAGRAMRAIAQDRRAAELMGIHVGRIYLQAFVIGTMLVGLAGMLLSPIFPLSPMVGGTFSTISFIVVVIGGLSSIPGAILGGLLIGVVESLAAFYLGPAFQQAAYFLLFILVLVFRPTGLFGTGRALQ